MEKNLLFFFKIPSKKNGICIPLRFSIRNSDIFQETLGKKKQFLEFLQRLIRLQLRIIGDSLRHMFRNCKRKVSRDPSQCLARVSPEVPPAIPPAGIIRICSDVSSGFFPKILSAIPAGYGIHTLALF